jgi:plasmid maintenance system antidote protein VapI
MPKTVKTPATVLQSLIDEYQISAFSLSKATHIDYQAIRKILNGTGKIRVPIAIKLGKFFGQPPAYFVNIQFKAIENELAGNKTFTKQLNSIQKAQKPTGKAASKTKAEKSKTNTLSAKRKKAAKIPRKTKAPVTQTT